MRKFVFYLLFFQLSVGINAQTTPFEDKATFEADIKQLANASKNPSFIQIINTFISQNWNNALLDDINKAKVVKICASLLQKPYPSIPYVQNFLLSTSKLLSNKDVTQSQIVNYFETLSKTIDFQDKVVVLNLMQTVMWLCEKQMLYYSYQNNVTLKDGTFDFAYEGFTEPTAAPAEPQENTENQDKGLFDTPTEATNTETQADIYQTAAPTYSLDGPLVKISNASLLLICRFDSLEVENTSGSLQINNRQFIGKKGKISWAHVGSDVANTYVSLGEYSLNTSNNDVFIENTTFYNDKLAEEITGIFEYKMPTSKNNINPTFPKFTSHSNNVVLRNLAKGLNYVGAFSLNGRKFSSASADDKESTIIYNDGMHSFEAKSKNFVFVDSAITSPSASVIIFIGNDSIAHPGVNFSFDPVGLKVKFRKEKGKFKNTYFRDTFHGFEIGLDVVDWNLKSDSIILNINAAKRLVPAIFKSTNYFNDQDFNKLSGVGNYNPLKILEAYQTKTKAELLYVDEIAKHFKINKQTLIGAMIDMDSKGFINYNVNSGQIIPLLKMSHMLQSKKGAIDFDNLYIPSLSPVKPNAVIRFNEENVMVIRGVKRFFISDSATVFAVPDSGEVKVYQNKDIYFDGVVVAGLFYFKGKKFEFHYDDFNIGLTQIDTIKFLKQKKTKKENNLEEKKFTDNNLVYSSGTLYINDPKNKSAKKKYPEYPMFDASTGAYVYFTSKEILNGSYDRRVYFKIPPFKTDSVKKADKKSLHFQGKFHSGGIFPDFDEDLKLMPDNSFGFKHTVPQEGYDVFGGKAKFFGILTLDNHGIRGNGELVYQTGRFMSNDIVFYQDSILAQGSQAKIKEKADSSIYFAEVSMADYEIKYFPVKDSMQITNINFPFELYKKKVNLEGAIILKPTGVFGQGLLEIKNEKVISPFIEFNKEDVLTRHSVLNSKLPGYEKNSIDVNNVKIRFNLLQSFADISPEIKGRTGLSFPLVEYSTSIENAKWDLVKKIVYMNADDESNISNSHFLATNPQYDSLQFNAAAAIYDINKKLLKVSGIPYIKVADSKIIPDSNKVLIKEEGIIRTLNNAKLIIDTTNAYHFLIKGKIDIESKYKFDGAAIYRYVNMKNDTFNIPFTSFSTEDKVINKKETKRFTVSDGEVLDKQKFYIVPKVLYNGRVKLVAPNPTLQFDGSVKIDVKNKELRTDWIPYRHDGSTKDFVVQLPKPIDPKSASKIANNVSEAGSLEGDTSESNYGEIEKMVSGIFYESGSNDLYTTLVSHRKNDDDQALITANGELRYDISSHGFAIGDKARLDNKTLQGNYYYYNDSSQTIICSGSLQLIKPNPNFILTSVGEAKELIAKNKVHLHSLLSIKMNLPVKALDDMSKKLKESMFEQVLLKDTIGRGDEKMTTLKIAQLAGDKVAKQYEKGVVDFLDYKPLFKYVPKLTEGIALSNVDFEWSNEHKAWYNVGKVRLSNILGNDFNIQVEAYIEIKQTEQGDNFTLMIKGNPEQWFYFNYQPGRLALLSTENDFNVAISSKSKGETGTPSVYSFVLADEAEQALFIKDFYKNYLGKNYDELDSYQELRKKEKEAEMNQNNDTQEPQPEENLEMVQPTKKEKKSKKSKKVDITSDELPSEPEQTPAEPMENEKPQPVEKKPKKAKKEVTPSEGNPTETEESPAPTKPSKKKKKVDITSDEIESTEPQEEPQPQEEAAPAEPTKKTKKKKGAE